MGIPVQRTYLGTPAALNAPVFMVDQQTLQNNFLTLTPNVLQDVVNNPDPAAGLLYSFTLVKNGNATAVRVPIGPVNMSSGSYQWQLTQTAGAVTATTILVRYGSPLN